MFYVKCKKPKLYMQIILKIKFNLLLAQIISFYVLSICTRACYLPNHPIALSVSPLQVWVKPPLGCCMAITCSTVVRFYVMWSFLISFQEDNFNIFLSLPLRYVRPIYGKEQCYKVFPNTSRSHSLSIALRSRHALVFWS